MKCITVDLRLSFVKNSPLLVLKKPNESVTFIFRHVPLNERNISINNM